MPRLDALLLSALVLGPLGCDGPRPVPMRDSGADVPTDSPPPRRDAPLLDVPDAFVPVPCGTASTEITARIVEGPSGEPLEGALVRVEGGCGEGLETTTDAAGMVSVRVDPAGAPWSLTAAMIGHRLVSILDVTSFALAGDIRLDRTPDPTYTTFPVDGTLSGAAAGRAVRIDGYDFGTLTAATATWTSEHYVLSDGAFPEPTRFAAVELDSAGDATNIAVTPEAARPSGPITGVSLALPTPAETPRIAHATIDVSGADLLLGSALLESANVIQRLEHPFDPYVYVGSATSSSLGPGLFDVEIRDFAVLPANWTIVRFIAPDGRAVMNVMFDALAGDTSVTVPTIDDLTVESPEGRWVTSTFHARGVGWDYAVLHLGEAAGSPPFWRIFAPMPDGAPVEIRVPQVPGGMAAFEILGAAPRESGLLMALSMWPDVTPWSLRARDSAVRGVAISLAGSYVTLRP